MSWKAGVAVVVVFGTVLVACGGSSSKSASSSSASSSTSSTVAPAVVPAKYQALESQVSGDLSGYESAIAKMAPLGKTATTGSNVGWAELLAANGNRQDALLAPTEMTTIDQTLDAFKRLGVGGVVLGIKMPLLLSSFEPKADQYAAFYATVADHARARGFQIDVELSALFCGTIYAQCSYQYPNSPTGWADLTAQQARIVIDRVHPEWLDLLSEPNTEVQLTGIKELGTIAGLTQFVTSAVNAIGAHGGTKLVAGAASWYGPTYDQALVKTPIDGLVTHIYPASATTAANLIATAKIAHDAGKPLIADETWLYKGQPTISGGVAASNEQGALCTYSFWQPLDVRFFRATRQWATKAGVPLISGFWSQLAFAYLTWTPTLDAQPPAQQLAASTQAAQTAASDNTTTQTGNALVGR